MPERGGAGLLYWMKAYGGGVRGRSGGEEEG